MADIVYVSGRAQYVPDREYILNASEVRVHDASQSGEPTMFVSTLGSESSPDLIELSDTMIFSLIGRHVAFS